MHDHLEYVYYVIDQLQTVVRNYITPIGVSCLGNSTYACTTPILQNAWSVPRGLATDFGLMSFAQPAGSPGVAVVGTRLWASGGWTLLGARVYLDFGGPMVSFPVASSSLRESYLALPLPAVSPGTKFYTQFFWPKPTSCGTGLGASNALTLTMQ
jgi:hypothetical protein